MELFIKVYQHFNVYWRTIYRRVCKLTSEPTLYNTFIGVTMKTEFPNGVVGLMYWQCEYESCFILSEPKDRLRNVHSLMSLKKFDL